MAQKIDRMGSNFERSRLFTVERTDKRNKSQVIDRIVYGTFTADKWIKNKKTRTGGKPRGKLTRSGLYYRRSSNSICWFMPVERINMWDRCGLARDQSKSGCRKQCKCQEASFYQLVHQWGSNVWKRQAPSLENLVRVSP